MDDLLNGIIEYVLGSIVIGGIIGFLLTLPKAMDYKEEFKKEPSWQLARKAFEHYRKCAIVLAVVVIVILFFAALIRG